MGEDNTNACSCSDLTQKLDMIIEELNIIKEGMATNNPKKKKRAPSKYNLYIGHCMKEGRGMKECAIEYKKEKENL